MYVRNNINLLTRGSTFVEWPIVQRTRDKFHQNAAHTRQISSKCSAHEECVPTSFQECSNRMPECPNRMPECPNRTVLTSFQECSNQTDYQICLVSLATIHQFRTNLHAVEAKCYKATSSQTKRSESTESISTLLKQWTTVIIVILFNSCNEASVSVPSVSKWTSLNRIALGINSQ